MLFREDPEGAIAISQPAHAWLTGQLARAWGNQQFGDFAPSEEVCLAEAMRRALARAPRLTIRWRLQSSTKR